MDEDGRLQRVFVVGCPRSGTTWTTLLLSQHPLVAVCPQTRVFLELQNLEQWWARTSTALVGRLGVGFDRASKQPLNRGQGRELLTSEDFYDGCRGFADTVIAQILRSKTGARVALEQTPEHVRVAEFILRVFPDAFFLHVIRDPRSVYASLRTAVEQWASPSVFPTSPVTRARMWIADVQAGLQIATHTDRYREVRYETLHADGAAELQRIFAWLELPADATFCDEALAACTLEKTTDMRGAPHGFFRRGSTTGWREELSRTELRILEHEAAALMKELGYEPSRPKPHRFVPTLALYEGRSRAVQALERVAHAARKRWG